MKDLFSFKGRVSRKEFWITNIVAGIGANMLSNVAFAEGLTLLLIPAIALGVIQLAVSVKRVHAVNMSGWWAIVPFVACVAGFRKDKADKDVQDKYK